MRRVADGIQLSVNHVVVKRVFDRMCPIDVAEQECGIGFVLGEQNRGTAGCGMVIAIGPKGPQRDMVGSQ